MAAPGPVKVSPLLKLITAGLFAEPVAPKTPAAGVPTKTKPATGPIVPAGARTTLPPAAGAEMLAKFICVFSVTVIACKMVADAWPVCDVASASCEAAPNAAIAVVSARARTNLEFSIVSLLSGARVVASRKDPTLPGEESAVGPVNDV